VFFVPKKEKCYNCFMLAYLILAMVFAVEARALSAENLEKLRAEEIVIPFPETVTEWNAVAPGEIYGTGSIKARVVDGMKIVYYRPVVWGQVEADFSDFKAKVAETLNSEQGWTRLGMRFVEVGSGQDLDIILAEPARLNIPGCSPTLSCTTWNNQVIINDIRWREGTEASRAGGMSQRDYQHMVVNHEVGHWLGHYAHVESCPNGGLAPIMLQQSTGMRGCDGFNAWPLDSELWTDK